MIRAPEVRDGAQRDFPLSQSTSKHVRQAVDVLELPSGLSIEICMRVI
jgi:hypothetical protein